MGVEVGVLFVGVVAAIFVRVWSAMQSGFVYRLNVPRRLLKATTTTEVALAAASSSFTLVYRTASPCPHRQNNLSCVLSAPSSRRCSELTGLALRVGALFYRSTYRLKRYALSTALAVSPVATFWPVAGSCKLTGLRSRQSVTSSDIIRKSTMLNSLPLCRLFRLSR